MACKCNKKTCAKCNPNSIADLQAKLAELNDVLNLIDKRTKYLSCGHPELLITHADDIDSFDFVTGKGSDCWDGWALCIGKTFYSAAKKKNIITPNFIDRFVVMAGGKYAVNDTGGTDSVILGLTEIPVHSHGIVDTGHTHGVTDTGHTHGVTDAGHTHTQNAHSHVYNDLAANQAGAYLSTTPSAYQAVNTDLLRTSQAATATNQSNITGISINSDPANISVDANETGIQVGNSGGGKAHENRPMFYAGVWVMYIG